MYLVIFSLLTLTGNNKIWRQKWSTFAIQ